MCGILGVISSGNLDLKIGLAELHHRGPDYSAQYAFENIRLGHTRLSILDIEPESNQPFRIGKHTLVFNGEIYNYLELKQILLSKGYSFRTKGDTEVLLTWLIHAGLEGVKDLDGMFAFAWLNEEDRVLSICRDSLGIKPVYIYQEENEVVFSSEIKPIFTLRPKAKSIDYSLMAEYLLNGFLYEPETGFENIRKLAPGTYETYDFQGYLIDKQVYWSLSTLKKRNVKINEVYTEIELSVEKHLIADVPVGLFYSGGIDSTILLSQTKSKIMPVTVKAREEEYEESGMTSDYSYALKIGNYLDIDVESIELLPTDSTNDDFLSLVEEVALGNEELIADFTFQSSKLLSQKVKEKDFTVMLSGMGADEIFAGYPRYKVVKYAYLFRILTPFVSLLRSNNYYSKKIERFINYFNEKDFGMSYSSLIGSFSRNEVISLLGNSDGIDKFASKIRQMLLPVQGYSDLRKAMFLDFYGFLSHNFLVSDKSSMQASIELRVPLATKKFYELSWGLKDSELMNLLYLKKPLRRFVLRFLPKRLIDRRKAGFNPPLDSYIQSLGPKKIQQVLEENQLFLIVEKSMVNNIIDEHFKTKKRNNTYKLYQLLHLSYWYKNFV